LARRKTLWIGAIVYARYRATPTMQVSSSPRAGMIRSSGSWTSCAAVGEAAILATDEESALLKNAAARERPNGQGIQSMPSSRTARSAVHTERAERNLQSLALSDSTRQVLEVSLDALTYGTAWARVESGFHYPSDIL
jgi:hypothetical protein